MTNETSIGYAILAGKMMGMSKEELIKLEYLLYRLMDTVTEEEAQEAYRKN